MTKEDIRTDTAVYQEVIPRRHREAFCNKTGCGGYSGDWVFGWPTNVDKSVHIKTQAERNLLKKLR